MKSSTCSRKAREDIEAGVRRRLAQHSNFACSICGSIPLVFHHIEQWSKGFSNDEELLIPICDKCHRRIHGEGGTVFSNKELYQYKAAPKKPAILRDELPLEAKKRYSFFIGGNFVADGETASLFEFPGGYSLMSIDTSSGVFRLSVLSGVQDDEPVYLIKQNELVIQSEDIWDMKYSGSSLKIWKTVDGNKQVFIDLVIKPDVIITRGMDTTFNGKPFCIRRLRNPQQRQVNKIVEEMRKCEELYRELSTEIESRPRIAGVYDGIDIDASIKQVQKDGVKIRLEQYLSHEFYKDFSWDWPYYQWVLIRVFQESPVFRRAEPEAAYLPAELKPFYARVARIKDKYRKEFEEVGNVVVEHDGGVWLSNIAV